MNYITKIFISFIFILFSYLQYNDGGDAYIWALAYFMTSTIVIFNSSITKYKIYFLISLCSFLFIQIINSLLTAPLVDELFYEFGGISMILIVCYKKLVEEN
jgi:hypothetical protein|tara:strand:+ start:275 stop:580 length:306 start_codon:yes stop_codon:yes gene_type:complete